MKCLPFMHDYRIIRWRLAHIPQQNPSTIIVRVKCTKCHKEKNVYTNKRDQSWEEKNRKYQGYWLGDEKYIEKGAGE